MIVLRSNYWTFAFSGKPSDVLNDEEGMQTMRPLGKIWLG